MRRRLMVLLLSLLPLLLVSGQAHAGSYLNRAALLLNGSRAERDMVLPRSNDKELLRIVHDVAAARTKSSRHMDVPKLVAEAHPHLMLVLENCERAYLAGLEGDYQRFVAHLLRARSEDETFRAIIRKLGYTLPST